jgi:microcystin-dependent protein
MIDYLYIYNGTIKYRKASNPIYRNLLKVIARNYGHNGAPDVQIYLPNLRERFPLGASGTKSIGTTGGTSAETLSDNQLPNGVAIVKNTGTTDKRAFSLNDTATGQWNAYNKTNVNTGKGYTHNNMPPYQVINYIIKYK